MKETVVENRGFMTHWNPLCEQKINCNKFCYKLNTLSLFHGTERQHRKPPTTQNYCFLCMFLSFYCSSISSLPQTEHTPRISRINSVIWKPRHYHENYCFLHTSPSFQFSFVKVLSQNKEFKNSMNILCLISTYRADWSPNFCTIFPDALNKKYIFPPVLNDGKEDIWINEEA